MRLGCFLVFLAFAAIVFFAAGPALGAPPGYTIAKIAHEGDPSPSGGTITQIFGDASIDDDGRVVFNGNDSGASQVILLWDGSNLSAGLSEGDVVPDTAGGTVLSPGSGRVAAPAGFSYTAIYLAAPPSTGAFRHVGMTGNALLLGGQAAPGGGNVLVADRMHDLNESGVAAFGGTVDPGGGGSLPTHFVGTPGALSEVYREGGTSPIGGTFTGVESYHRSALAADGSLAFAANVAGGSSTSGLFRWSGGTVAPLLVAGTTLPAGLGTVQAFGLQAGSNEQGDVAFNADVLLPAAAFATEGVYIIESGLVRKILHHEESISGTNPTLVFQGLLGSTPPDPSANGITTFTALLEDPVLSPLGAVVAEHGGVSALVSLTGTSAPGVTGGALFTNYSDARINSSGQIVFTASTTAGVGVFVATPSGPPLNEVPSSGTIAVCILVAGILLTGTAFARRQTRLRAFGG